MTTFKTDRLLLQPLRPEDGPALHAFFSDPESMRFMPEKPHRSPKQTAQSIRLEISRGARYWTILLRERAAAGPIGYAGFLGSTRVPGMGYLLRREYWNQGLVTEAIPPLLEHGFNKLGHDRVELWINEQNAASLRVAQKLGFQTKGRIHQRYSWEARHHIMLTFGLRKSEWAGAKPAPSTRGFSLQPVLPTHDIRQTTAFYREKLGFEIDFIFGDPPSHCGVAWGDWSAESLHIQFTLVEPDTVISPQGWLYFMVGAGIDALFERWRDDEVEVLRPPETHPWGMREFSIRDPNGYELRFGTQAGWP